jgi:hypothetical protein
MSEQRIVTREALAAALDVLSEDGLEYALMAPEEREDRDDAAERLFAALPEAAPASGQAFSRSDPNNVYWRDTPMAQALRDKAGFPAPASGLDVEVDAVWAHVIRESETEEPALLDAEALKAINEELSIVASGYFLDRTWIRPGPLLAASEAAEGEGT